MFSTKIHKSELAKTQTSSKQPSSAAQSNSSDKWSELELQLLVKATTLFPIGTATRWDVIADYINEHGQNEGNRKNGKQVIFKVKNLKKSGKIFNCCIFRLLVVPKMTSKILLPIHQSGVFLYHL